MCEWGDTVMVMINGKPVFIDRCIADLVEALNKAGYATVASCCGHGKMPGNIALADGRELFICPDYQTARRIDKAWLKIFKKKDIIRRIRVESEVT